MCSIHFIGAQHMSIQINGQTYYTTTEACLQAGISRSTLLRWFKVGIVEEVIHKDRRGWRMFTEDDINRIIAESKKIEVEERPSAMKPDTNRVTAR